jgi:hypothetical protein
MYQNTSSFTGRFFCLPVALLFFCACNGPSAHEQRQKKLLTKLSATQQAMIEFTRQQTIGLYAGIEDRLKDPVTAEKTKIWEPKAMQVSYASKTITRYFNNMTTSAKTSTAKDWFISSEQAADLYRQLYMYKKTILETDPEIKNVFAGEVLKDIDTLTDIKDDKSVKAAAAYFEHIDKTSEMVMLQNLEQEVALIENKVVTFCFHKTTANFCGITQELPLITQNSTILQTGEQLIITAGIGSYTYRVKPKVTINGRLVPLSDAVATYSVKISQGAGKYSIPIDIEYLDESGISRTYNTIISYTIK